MLYHDLHVVTTLPKNTRTYDGTVHFVWTTGRNAKIMSSWFGHVKKWFWARPIYGSGDMAAWILDLNVYVSQRKHGFWWPESWQCQGMQDLVQCQTRTYSIGTIYTCTRLLHVQGFDIELSPAWCCNRSRFLTSSWISSSKFNFTQKWLSQPLIHCLWHIR